MALACGTDIPSPMWLVSLAILPYCSVASVPSCCLHCFCSWAPCKEIFFLCFVWNVFSRLNWFHKGITSMVAYSCLLLLYLCFLAALKHLPCTKARSTILYYIHFVLSLGISFYTKPKHFFFHTVFARTLRKISIRTLWQSKCYLSCIF